MSKRPTTKQEKIRDTLRVNTFRTVFYETFPTDPTWWGTFWMDRQLKREVFQPLEIRIRLGMITKDSLRQYLDEVRDAHRL